MKRLTVKKPVVRRPSGFTMLETLLALTLCSLVLAAAWSSTELYWNFRTRSQDRIGATSVLRAVAEDLQADLRAVVAPPAAVPDDIDPEEDENSTFGITPQITEGEFRNQLMQLDPLASLQPVTFAGGPDWLLILTSNPAPGYGVSDSGLRQRHTIWCSAQGQLVNIPIARLGDSFRHLKINLRQQPAGLVRVERPFILARHRPASAAQQPLAEIRVSSIRFEYFDGTSWIDTWDASLQRGIPLAVRAYFRLTDDDAWISPVVVEIPQGLVQQPKVAQ